MEIISNTALILCTSTIACVVIRMVLPEGRTRKTMNLIITAFLIIIMIAPVKNLFSKADNQSITTPNETEIVNEYNSKVLSLTQENIRKSLITLLNQNGIKPVNVFLSLKTDSDNGIYISYISIYLNEKNKIHTQKAVKITEDNFCITPEIVLC